MEGKECGHSLMWRDSCRVKNPSLCDDSQCTTDYDVDEGICYMCVERHHYLKEQRRREERGEEEGEVGGEVDERQIEVERKGSGEREEDGGDEDGEETVEVARDAMSVVERESDGDDNGLRPKGEKSPKVDDKTMAKKKQLAEIEREIEVARMMEEDRIKIATALKEALEKNQI
ncbi:hypothetical protein GLAREA_06632 [Glarea lozoyensis ATCC 20868]|uniref:Uncharacterized protein n=1 Tax=Glarea lozoyensis (strain ATCC 20868 / MF5171) TaxID=1116229 RepID=S3D905_GLAL2|nr:uncharacterized protein GLAREA_06632 [Glarea lozoyensis ATCC 20868]EPE33619.1 hypothetical protein GLAREA_06632 [Glarea lozoyensis ATCC 20868]